MKHNGVEMPEVGHIGAQPVPESMCLRIALQRWNGLQEFSSIEYGGTKPVTKERRAMGQSMSAEAGRRGVPRRFYFSADSGWLFSLDIIYMSARGRREY